MNNRELRVIGPVGPFGVYLTEEIDCDACHATAGWPCDLRARPGSPSLSGLHLARRVHAEAAAHLAGVSLSPTTTGKAR